MLTIHPDFSEFLSLLSTHRVEYLLVGGYAVALHGYPRFTGDLDVWITATSDNGQRIVALCREFGFDVPNLSAELFESPTGMTRMGHPPLQIKILNSVSGLTFADAWPRRVERELGGIIVSVVCLDDLRANKLASGRLKDLADLENLPLV